MSSTKRLHARWQPRKGWLAPTTMVLAFVAGIAFAAGHHFFYHHLDGKTISETTYLNSSFTSQQLNIAIGTAFAFVFQACLVQAVSVAFIQAFYYRLLHQKAHRTPTQSDLDGAHSALNDVFMMFNMKLWWKLPTLLLLATIARMIPIAAIITPATLSIRTASISPPRVSSLRVPNLDFRNLNFLEDMPNADATYSQYRYKGPSVAVRRIADAVLAEGEILPLTAPPINTSWSLQYFGPYLKCDDMSSITRRLVEENIGDALKIFRYHYDIRSYNYLAWIPSATGNQTQGRGLPFHRSKELLKFDSGSITSSLKLSLVVIPTELDRFNLYVLPRNWSNGSTWLQCQIFNSTYDVHFSYIEGIQNITAKILYNTTDHSVPATDWVYDLVYNNKSETNGRCSPTMQGCLYQPDIFQRLSYQAIFDAFTKSILGQLWFHPSQAEPPGIVQRLDSQIFETTLQNTPELSKLVSGENDGNSLQEEFLLDSRPSWRGLSTRTRSTAAKLPLRLALEQMFQNITISLMSSKDLQPNYTSITAPGPVNVTFHRVHSVYSYAAWKLWIAYGIAILLSALAVLVGAIYIELNAATFSDNFSTIFRIAKGAEISVPIDEKDLDGRDPLPTYLARATIRPMSVAGLAASKQHSSGSGQDVGGSNASMRQSISLDAAGSAPAQDLVSSNASAAATSSSLLEAVLEAAGAASNQDIAGQSA